MTDKKLRLFAIRDTTFHTVLKDEFFSDKPSAKRRRDQLNSDSTRDYKRFVVCPGPDHRRYSPR